MSTVSRASRHAKSFRHGALALALTAALGGGFVPATGLARTSVATQHAA